MDRKIIGLIFFVFVVQLTFAENRQHNPPIATSQIVESGGTAITHTGEGDINITGYTIKEHQKILKADKAVLRKNLEALHQSNVENLNLKNRNLALEKQLLEKQIAEIESKLNNIDESYTQRIAFFENTIKTLRSFKGAVSDVLLDDAEVALREGKTDKADKLYAKIEAQEKDSIERAAKAAFERGRIAKEKVDYSKAFKHYERAVGLSPENPLYLSEAGVLAGIVALYDKELEWKEKALMLYLVQMGEASPEVAVLRNNLGLAWKSLGQYKKAIEYYELALASDLKTLGEDHPKVATYRNNLGLAWYSLGQYKKAIEYYERALATFKKVLGVDHHSSKTVMNNLASIKQQEKELIP